jgi:hypothetical protein
MSAPPERGRSLRAPWAFGSGPAVGALYGRLLAAFTIVAWASLGSQVRVLVGSHGLLPVDEFMQAVDARGGVSWWALPTAFRWLRSDGALVAGVWVGAALGVGALLFGGVPRRVCFALSTALYLSYATACRVFLSFQWDNLLLECGLLAAFLPSDRRAPLVHFLFRVVLFKLYFESGLAKFQSPLHDWHDGSAMTYYYETAPLPTFLGWYAHNLPTWWHHFESRATLVLELGVPFAIFGPRRARLAAAVAFTGFQVANAATANYGFFCYLAAALHVFLLDDTDVERARAFVVRFVAGFWARRAPARVQGWTRSIPWPRRRAPAAARVLPAPLRWLGGAAAAFFVFVSLIEGLLAFAPQADALVQPFVRLLEVDQSLRLINTYHLFASITRERVEPELETLDVGGADGDGGDGAWAAHHLWHKPGDLGRAPDFVAPHQPRLDFQLWFHGLGFRRGQPAYVSTLLELLCEDPSAVQPLFRDPLPPRPRAVRIAYWQYHFTTPAERRATSAWWRRERVGTTRPVPCPAAAAR